MKAVTARAWKSGRPFAAPMLLLSLLLVACLALGGSSRDDVWQLMLLYPIASLALAAGLWTLRLHHIRRYRFAYLMALGVIAIPLLQLVPLPPALWHQLPGRELIEKADRLAGLDRAWRPLTMTPFETRGALFALMVPLAVLVLGSQLDRRDLGERSLLLALGLGLLSAAAGLLQILGPDDGPLYLYPVTNSGLAVGLFANRNHQALLLLILIPMLTVQFARLSGRAVVQRSLLIMIGLLLLPMILITGSRMGLIGAVAAIMAIPLFTGRPSMRAFCSRPRRSSGRWLPGWSGVLLAIGLVAVTIWLNRAVAVNRLLEQDPADQLRVTIVPALRQMILHYFPFGSGVGSFEKVYFVNEPELLLGSTYMNQAHDDWLQAVLAAGLPAVVMLLIAAGAFVVKAWRVLAREAAGTPGDLERLGLVVILLFGVASAVDYPLRTPAMAALFVLAALWSQGAGPSDESAATPLLQRAVRKS